MDRVITHNAQRLGAYANVVAMREWNHSEVYRKTIVLMAQRLGGG